MEIDKIISILWQEKTDKFDYTWTSSGRPYYKVGTTTEKSCVRAVVNWENTNASIPV